jgi:CBS domain containing-hemolysin-like protein
MGLYLAIGGLLAAALMALFFSTLAFGLRDFSRGRLAQSLARFGRADLLERTIEEARDLIFVTSVIRLFANIMVLVCVLRVFIDNEPWFPYVLSVVVAGIITLLTSVAVPLAAARYAGETIIASVVGPLHILRILFSPVTKISHWIDAAFRQAAGPEETHSQSIEQEILSVVEEGEKEGVVDEQEREMIESVIEFRDTTVGQIMTARPEMVAIELPANLPDIIRTIEETGHSRIPVYERTLDHIVGVLYARDLLKFVGRPPQQFDLRSILRPALYVPDTKPLRDLLQDFRLQKVHLAIVLDEYSGTVGLVTIEDIVEELVGDISDEHEPAEPALLKRINDQVWEADARVYVDELNRTIGLKLPEDAGYDTLGGFVTTTLGRIPTAGTIFEHANVKYTILEAEPQKVNRVRVEVLNVSASEGGGASPALSEASATL